MSAQWHLSRDGQQHGPYTWDQIREFALEGRLSGGDMLWSPELSGWTEASRVPGLSMSNAGTGGAGAHGHARGQASSGSKSGSGKLVLFALAAGLFLSVVTVGGLAGLMALLDDGGPSVDRPTPRDARAQDESKHRALEAGTRAPGEDDTDEAGVEELLPEPWITAFAAEKSEIETGGSTAVRLNVSDPRRGEPTWRVTWESSCGAAAPAFDDDTRAVFFAPPRPGWCQVKATLVEPPGLRIESTIDILVTPSLDQTL